jgi:hypothetical protein
MFEYHTTNENIVYSALTVNYSNTIDFLIAFRIKDQ